MSSKTRGIGVEKTAKVCNDLPKWRIAKKMLHVIIKIHGKEKMQKDIW